MDVKKITEQDNLVRLSDLEKGAVAIIDAFDEKSSDFVRLRDMGLHIGTDFRVIKFAPGGDPIEIKARGYYMSLRKSAAQHIIVKRK